MQADNTHHLLAAARERSEKARARTAEAMTQLLETGRATTVSELARTAGVSRSWLYTQPDLLDLLQQQKSTNRPPTPGSSTRASDSSLHRRLQLAHQRIRQLRDENEPAARTTGTDPRSTPGREPDNRERASLTQALRVTSSKRRHANRHRSFIDGFPAGSRVRAF